MAKYLDDNGLLYFWTQLKSLFAGKVDKVDGKGLSTNDYTTAEKNKLAGIASGATATTVENVLTSTSTTNALSAAQGKVLNDGKLATNGNGSNVTVTFSAASSRANLTSGEKLSVSLGKLAKWYSDLKAVAFSGAYSDLSGAPSASSSTPAMDGTGSAGSSTDYARADHVHPKDTTKANLSGATFTGAVTLAGAPTSNLQAATKKYVDDAISGLGTLLIFKGTVATVGDLPSTGNKAGDVYIVTADSTEYVWTGTAWEQFGITVDLSAYWAKADLTAITNTEIDTILAA